MGEVQDPSVPWGVRLNPKTRAEKELEHRQDLHREYHRRTTQILKLANNLKQMDVYSNKYKEFDTEESLLNPLQDVLEQKGAGFDI